MFVIFYAKCKRERESSSESNTESNNSNNMSDTKFGTQGGSQANVSEQAQDWLTGLETYFREKGINENDWERAAHPLILFNIFKKEQTGTYFVQGPVARFFL